MKTLTQCLDKNTAHDNIMTSGSHDKGVKDKGVNDKQKDWQGSAMWDLWWIWKRTQSLLPMWGLLILIKVYPIETFGIQNLHVTVVHWSPAVNFNINILYQYALPFLFNLILTTTYLEMLILNPSFGNKRCTRLFTLDSEKLHSLQHSSSFLSL